MRKVKGVWKVMNRMKGWKVEAVIEVRIRMETWELKAAVNSHQLEKISKLIPTEALLTDDDLMTCTDS